MIKSCVLLLLVTAAAATMTAQAQGTAFTYQGRLQNNGAPANGSYDLMFTLYSTNVGGVAVAGPVTESNTAVSNGLFTVTIDFGAGAFTGNDFWLDIDVSPAGSNAFIDLSPRQPILPTPYAMMANTASNLLGRLPGSQLTGPINASQLNGPVPSASLTSVPAANLTGTVPLAQLPSTVVTNTETGVTLSGTFSGVGSGLTALNPANLSAGTAAINISGNAATATSATTAANATAAATATLASNLASGATITSALVTNSSFAGNGGGLTNLAASQLNGSVPSASLTSVPAGNLTGTVPLAQLPTAVLTNTETGVTLSGTFSGSFSGTTSLSAASISTNGSTSGQVLTSSGGATVWANVNPSLGGVPTLVTNGLLSTNAFLTGKDHSFFLGFITSTNSQQNYAKYFTIKLSQAVSTNAVIATFSPGSFGTWTNSAISIGGFTVFLSTFQVVTTSNSVTVESISAPQSSASFGMFVHVDQY
ncbi:MAG TPA: hypothetical protein VNV43_07210 [Candidatus Acidoferrales bacterium]|nr:hypothetical protein [Candidatus Acidoferrales bacterium]